MSFLSKGNPVFQNPGIIICYGKEKQARNELHDRKLNIKIVCYWNSKIKAWKQKKQKVFEFSIEFQMPKQNGKKYITKNTTTKKY